MDRCSIQWDQKNKITAFENTDYHLYIGTNDGKIYVLSLQMEKQNESEDDKSIVYFHHIILNRQISKNRITHILVDEEYNIMFIKHDNYLFMYEISSLQRKCKVKESKGIRAFCRSNEGHRIAFVSGSRKIVFFKYNKNFKYNIFNEVKLSTSTFIKSIKKLGKIKIGTSKNKSQKKKLQIDKITSASFKKNKILSIAWKNTIVCIGISKEFVLINTENGERLNDIERKIRLNDLNDDINYNYRDFVKVFGLIESQYVLVKFTSPISMGLCFPFLVSLNNSEIEIYNFYQGRKTHKFIFKNGVLVSDHSRRCFVVSPSQILILTPNSIDDQIKHLIRLKRIDEGISLFEKTFRGNLKTKRAKQSELFQMAGCQLLFLSKEYSRAFKFFMRIQCPAIDPCEILYFFPDLLPDSFYQQEIQFEPKITRRRGTISQSINAYLSQKKCTKEEITKNIRLCYFELQKFLEHRLTKGDILSLTNEQKSLSVYALCVLYLRNTENFSKLKKLIIRYHSFLISDMQIIFKRNPVFLSYFYWFNGNKIKSLEILKKIGEKKIINEEFITNGIPEMVELLSSCDEEELIFKYINHIFQNDEELGIEIFISKSRKKELNMEKIHKFLMYLPSDFERKYLEYLIFEKRINKEKFNTSLILNYIEIISKLKPKKYYPIGLRVTAGTEDGLLGELRRKLLILLKENNRSYNEKEILSELNKSNLYEELIYLCKKMSYHRNALITLLKDIKDYEWVEKYCLDTFLEMKQKQKLIYNPLLIILLDICFNRDPKNPPFGLYILQQYAQVIDPLESLQIIPDDYTIKELSQYLKSISSTTLSRNRNSGISCNMNNFIYVKAKAMNSSLLARKIILQDDSRCLICLKEFKSNSPILIRPNMKVVHHKCVTKGKYEKKK